MSQATFHEISHFHSNLWNAFKTIPHEVDEATLAEAFLDVIKRYSEPHRCHHTLTHIEDLVSQYWLYKDSLADSASAVLCAIFYHDIVYNCAHGIDEKESAELADKALTGMKVPEATRIRAIDLILATAKHEINPKDIAGNLFLDMDMSILASHPDIYAQYVQNTRFEYCQKLNLTEAVFNEARAQRFLLPILNSNIPIFKTEQFKSLEDIARQNMAWELGLYGHHFNKASLTPSL